MWELGHKEGWALRNWCFWIVVLEKILESPLDSREIKPINRKGNQPWIFTGRTNAEAKALILWPPDVKSQLTGKAPDAGKDWRQEKKGATEAEMVRWHHWLNGHESEQTLGDGEAQGSLVLQSMGSQRAGQHLATEQQDSPSVRTLRATWSEHYSLDTGTLAAEAPVWFQIDKVWNINFLENRGIFCSPMKHHTDTYTFQRAQPPLKGANCLLSIVT